MKRQYEVTADDQTLTLAALLRKREPALAWSKARALVERGKVRVDGELVIDAARRLRTGQQVLIDDNAPKPPPAVVGQARIVWEDAHVVVLSKPSGVSSVPFEKRESGTALDQVRGIWRHEGRRDAADQALFVVHRIDKETSGLLAFAKSKLAERGMATLFRTHEVERTYLCVAHGDVGDTRIESRLVDDRGDGLRGSSRRPHQGKRAVTHVRALERLGGVASLLEVRLETGKTHQIRIHLSELRRGGERRREEGLEAREPGHPLVGERVYIRDFTALGGEPLASERLLLHAATLGFRHPVTGEQVQLSEPLPADFSLELERLRRRAGQAGPRRAAGP
jgi:23S rRNA pseudouridine1911/1915/1917 synthase